MFPSWLDIQTQLLLFKMQIVDLEHLSTGTSGNHVLPILIEKGQYYILSLQLTILSTLIVQIPIIGKLLIK